MVNGVCFPANNNTAVGSGVGSVSPAAAAGLDPNSYFGPGGRHNMRRKSDCGAERGGAMQIPDPSYFASKKRNRSLDRTDELEDFAQQQQQQQAAAQNAPPGLLQFQMMYQRRQSAARGENAVAEAVATPTSAPPPLLMLLVVVRSGMRSDFDIGDGTQSMYYYTIYIPNVVTHTFALPLFLNKKDVLLLYIAVQRSWP